MGDISVIARRRQDGSIQYGWSGNGGYFSNVGDRLLYWYNDPDMVDYLFSLGQLAHLGPPLSEMIENPRSIYSTFQTGEEHWEGISERWMFSQIAFIDYGYLYDLDECWYYINPGPIRIKIPLKFIGNHLDDRGYEFDYVRNISVMVADQILKVYPKKDAEFADLLSKYDMEKVIQTVAVSEFPIYKLYENYHDILMYLDDWVVVIPDEECKEVACILIRKREKPRIETIDWPGHPARKVK